MNELQKVVANISTQNTSISHFKAENLPKLTNQESIYYQAKKTSVLVEMKENEIWDECLKVIIKTFDNLNKDLASPSAKEEIKKLTTILRDLIQTSPQYSGLTSGELNLAFDYGIRGEYGEFYGLNIKTFAQWLKGYEQDEIRLSAMKKVFIAKSLDMGFKVEEKEVTDVDMAQCVLNDLRTLKSGCSITGFKMFFDWCWKRFEEFKPTEEQRQEAIRKVKAKLIYDLKMQRIGKYANNEAITKQIDKLESGKYDDEFFSLCKIEHYKTYLTNSPMMFEKKLEQIINE